MKEKMAKIENSLKKTSSKKKRNVKVERTLCKDNDCPFHGKLKTRGRTFKGKVKRKLPRRIMIEFERMTYVKKYERYAKSKTKIHARLPDCLKEEVNIGDTVLVKECRPLSKIVHFVVIKKIKNGKESK